MSKKQPTAYQRRLRTLVANVGCMACLQDGVSTQPEIHHWRPYGYKDENKILGLCPAHHGTVPIQGVPNRHWNKKEFEAKYGTDEQLYVRCMQKLGLDINI